MYFSVMDENNILLERLKANDEAAYQELFCDLFQTVTSFCRTNGF